MALGINKLKVQNPHLQQAGGTLAVILYQQGRIQQLNATNDEIYLY
ncbi:hypothetical protein FLJC2902T_25390 [Flavobacterium limnosediminis JC2902]|uniref:Uncharacterized protein n=1 Tax=Flavobacterium limnosediminis JC2902 TaxID=1341181 RepID=V6SJU6_9FLAO|nr:hypothetical protein FLJC2902T_25390 [Flavobacterium limnosediminis JC2902]